MNTGALSEGEIEREGRRVLRALAGLRAQLVPAKAGTGFVLMVAGRAGFSAHARDGGTRRGVPAAQMDCASGVGPGEFRNRRCGPRQDQAGATATDALWAGLPIVTCLGESFPGRVAASVLQSIGLPELVTASLAEYKNLARTRAQDQERLTAIKLKLMRNRETEALFDTVRFTRDLESAYTAMWDRQQTGLPPASFAVSSQGDLIRAL